MFKEGELVTAIADDDYAITINGWTGKVIKPTSYGCMEVEAAELNETFHEKSWEVDGDCFVPYSPNMETSNLGNFHFCRSEYNSNHLDF